MEENKKNELQTRSNIIEKMNITGELLNKSNNIITIQISNDVNMKKFLSFKNYFKLENLG